MVDWLPFASGNGKPKWLINEHRVRSYTVKIPGTEVHGDMSGVTAQRKKKFECVDCERTAYTREKFETVDCYERI